MDLKILSFYLVLSFLALSYGSEESFQDLDQLLNDPDIWQYIEKRVSNKEKVREEDDEQGKRPIHDTKTPISPQKQRYSEPSTVPDLKETRRKFDKLPTKNEVPNGMKTLLDSSGNKCSFGEKYNMIIRSKTSLSAGAFFLKSELGLSSEECAKKCCYTQNCNLAVYEDKEEHSCYLFDCNNPSTCSFAHHGNYSVMTFSNHNYEPHQHQLYHENELESLSKTTTSIPTTAAPTTKAPKYETPAPIPPRIKVPLFGDCDTVRGEHCGNRNAVCDDGQCVCKKGFHPVEAYCREICSKDEFTCKNKGKDNTVPDCIDIKYKCDGVPQCADDSDEENCPTKDSKESEGHKEPKIPVDDKDSDENEPEDKATSKPPRPINPHLDKFEETDDNKSDEEGDEEDKEIGDSDRKEEKTKEKQDSVTKSTTSATETPKAPRTTTVTTKLEGPQKVKVISPTDSNQGPIVALALGLGICLMLLIFVGCRLRTVKRRLRRGKSLHSNEADYLINGMYL